MKKEDMAEFAKWMSNIGLLYNKDINEYLIEFYWQAFQPFSLRAVKTALQSHVKNPDSGQYFPKPADLLRYLETSHSSHALRAWGEVHRAIRTVGCYESVVFDDPIIHAVIADMGGWLRLCRMTESETPWREKEFERRYTDYAANPPSSYPGQLLGLIAVSHQQQGLPAQAPRLLGDGQKAQRVYQQGNAHEPAHPAALLGHKKTLQLSCTL